MATITATRMFIAGAWEDALSGEVADATSPATGQGLGAVAQGDREDARRAVAAAKDAFPAWARETAFARADALRRVADVCERRRDELARALTLDQGKPLHAEAYDEVDELVAMWRGAAEDGIRLEGAIAPSMNPGKRVLLVRRPLGPVAVVTPWNWPYTMPAEIVAPALACGNTVVWTPAPTTAVCSGLLADCVAEADLPPGVFNFVTGPGPVVGDELVGHPDVVGVGFIGSTATGLHIARRAAGKAQLLEMGGNGPLVVMDDADVGAAVEAAVVACFLCAGQSCTAGELLLVHAAVREEFVARLAERVARGVVLGDPFAESTTMGPLNNEPVAAKMDEHVGDAAARGASVVTGGARADGFPTSLYWPATILDGVPADARAATEETFGPIAPVVPIASMEEAIEITNASGYGLLSAIFTADVARGLRFADEVRTGLVNINETTNYWENHLPFGGRAGTASGVGRVGGRYPMETLTELQTVVISA
ncbi:MAG TPA: aldehyde dehydrogenase family protein [Solirubrobacteraceae bacterium]|nr:aldehyde dehydrogenase family protein [Solirubrobacteraceae bacterium]